MRLAYIEQSVHTCVFIEMECLSLKKLNSHQSSVISHHSSVISHHSRVDFKIPCGHYSVPASLHDTKK